MRFKRIAVIVGLCGLLVGLGLWLVATQWVARTIIPLLTPHTSVTVEDHNGDLLRAYTVADGRWRLPVSLGDVDPRFIENLIAYEDKRFYQHRGVDIRAVSRAFAQAVWNGRFVSGGSTLTMQVARLLEGGGTGRWRPKLRQARLALALEQRLSKDEILTLYLKLAPYGGNLEGLRAASLSYFGKEPLRLTSAQSALLVALPQAPESRRPDRAPNSARAARNRVLDRLVSAGVLEADEANAAKRESAPETRLEFPATAPHLADQTLKRRPRTSVHRLTIKRDLQVRLEALAARHSVSLGEGLSAAIVVMDHKSGAVLASVGSAGYLDQSRRGYNDMTRAIRSPGSTLKPLIYGLAFEAGLAHPETLIDDKPAAFSGYAPLNFDKQFYGTISVRDALRHSLNIPAVALLEAVGPAQLTARMRRAGVEARLPDDAPPGLAIALGGLGISLNDLVTLYAAIARGGQPVQMSTRLGEPMPDGPRQRLLSPEAAWQVADILTGVVGPELAPDNNLAYKTGTSYGYRDAWAIGFDGAHVIGVWLGRPDGGAVPGSLGAGVAAPLLFEAFGRLKTELVPLSPPPPGTLMVSHANLPQPLKRFRGPNAVFELTENSPEIAFPPDGARVELASEIDMPLVLKVRGGTPPFTWIADGIPFHIAVRRREVEWYPDGPGFARLSVIDASGLSENVAIELRIER